MATTATVAALGALSVLGFTVSAALPPQAATDLPWKDIAGGSAALLMFAALVVVLRHLVQERNAQAAERASSQAHVEKVTQSFSDTATSLFRENREDNQAARKELQDLIRDLRRPNP